MLRAVGNPLTSLSGRERVVAARFAEGMTYREIGETLFIAPTTVRTHLSAIYRKLGVRSKVALATLLADHREQDTDQGLPEDLPAHDSGPPIIAVVPFDNLSGDEYWTRLADGLSADIIVDLARYPDLAVIACQTMLAYKDRRDDVRSIGRELNADYVLEGTLQAAGQEVRIAVQLVDAGTGVALWTARYDRPAEDLFAMQDSVTENVINILASSCGKLASLRRDVARRKHPANLRAYDCYLLGVEACHKFTPASNREAIRLQSRAVELDPGLARAWAALGLAYSVDVMNAYSTNPAATFKRWETCLEKALALDPADSLARISLGDLRALQGDLKKSAEHNEQALAMAPNDADVLAMSAGSRALVAGDPKQGYALAKRAIRLNPHMPWYHAMLGRCSFVLGLYRECLEEFEQTPQESPATLLFVVMAHAMLNEMSHASKVTARLASEFPDFTVETLISGYPVTNPPALAAIREAARRAGLSSL
jgi:TolB-like protein/DNA-binding CsgD family transcriptional regulator